MIDVRVATWADIETVLANLSDQNTAEYEAVGLHGDDLRAKMCRFMLQGETECAWFDGAPQSVFCVVQTPVFGAVTWFLATKAYFAAGPRAVIAGRKQIRAARQRHGPITSFVTSAHPDVDRWLRVLGFVLSEPVDDTPRYIFR